MNSGLNFFLAAFFAKFTTDFLFIVPEVKPIPCPLAFSISPAPILEVINIIDLVKSITSPFPVVRIPLSKIPNRRS